jgi:hypothetical protein
VSAEWRKSLCSLHLAIARGTRFSQPASPDRHPETVRLFAGIASPSAFPASRPPLPRSAPAFRVSAFPTVRTPVVRGPVRRSSISIQSPHASRPPPHASRITHHASHLTPHFAFRVRYAGLPLWPFSILHPRHPSPRAPCAFRIAVQFFAFSPERGRRVRKLRFLFPNPARPSRSSFQTSGCQSPFAPGLSGQTDAVR